MSNVWRGRREKLKQDMRKLLKGLNSFMSCMWEWFHKCVRACMCVCVSNSMSNSLQPHGLYYGILQARILEWIAFPFSKGSSQPRDWTQVSHIAGGFFINWAAREAQIHGSEHYFLNQLASAIWAKSPPCISLVFTTVPSRAVGIWKAFSKCL